MAFDFNRFQGGMPPRFQGPAGGQPPQQPIGRPIGAVPRPAPAMPSFGQSNYGAGTGAVGNAPVAGTAVPAFGQSNYGAGSGAIGNANPPGATPRSPLMGSFKKGGKVKKTGNYKLHKGERVLTAKQAKIAPVALLLKAKKG